VQDIARKASVPERGSAQGQILEQLQLRNAWLSVKQVLDTAAVSTLEGKRNPPPLRGPLPARWDA
jgi:hypothetical protein